MGNLKYINSLDWTEGEFLSLMWTVDGVPGRVVLAKSPRAAALLARHATGESKQVVFGVAFGTDDDYSNFCEHSDAEGIPRDDE